MAADPKLSRRLKNDKGFRIRSQVVRSCLRALGSIVVLLAVFALLTGDRFTPVRLLLYVAPLVGIGAAALAFALFFARAWILGALVAMTAAVLLGPLLTRFLPLDPPAADGSARIRVLTISVRGGAPDMGPTAALIRRHSPDLVMLQEVSHVEELLAALSGRYPSGTNDTGAWHVCRSGPTLLLSRYPLGDPHPANAVAMVLCPVLSPFGRFWAGSMRMPKARYKAVEVAGQRTAYQGLIDTLDTLDAPVVLAGDFNVTPLTTPYRMVGQRLWNAFSEAGAGFGFTFPTASRPLLGSLGPFLRIDHVFHDSAFRALSAEVLDEHPPTADHFPVMVDLEFRVAPDPVAAGGAAPQPAQ